MAAFKEVGKFRSWKALVWLAKQSKETSSNYTKWTTIPPSYSLHTGSSIDTTVLQQQQQPLKPSTSSPLSPAVRFLIDSNQLDPADIPATGPKLRLLKGDVLKYLTDLKTGKKRSTTAQPTPTKPVKPVSQASQVVNPGYEDIPLTSMRQTIAKRLTLSKTTIPYSYTVMECRIDNLLELRRKIMKEKEVKITLNDLLVKAVALTLEHLPESNATWSNDTVQLLPTIDVGVAVAVEGGLITPIINNANRLSVSDVSIKIKELADKARNGKLKPHEYQGGSFCISNLGMYGVTEFTAIINPPQSGILAVGGIQMRPHPEDEAEDLLKGAIKTIIATLSCDTRVIDNELASKWLTFFREAVESPMMLGLL